MKEKTVENINWIENTPMGINVRAVQFIAPHTHTDYIEIVLCLGGEIKFSYYYEEFTLRAGDFILVDKDAHYLYDSKDATCVFFYIDLKKYTKKYPFIMSSLFVCEGVPGVVVPHDTPDHNRLKGMLLALLVYVSENRNETEKCREKINETSDRIVDLLCSRFDILFWYNPGITVSEKVLDRHRKIIHYMNVHYAEDITLTDIARECGISETYASEFISRYMLGFQKMLAYIRAWKAETLLLYTDMNVTEISEEVNFSDTKYFYKAFKYWYHCTPNEFRKSYTKEMGVSSVEENLKVNEVMAMITDLTRKHFVTTFI